MYFSNTHWAELTVPLYSILFETSICQFNSSKCCPMRTMRFWWGQRTPDTRSETIPSSRITPDLQIHSFFSSVHLTHLLQGSDSQLLLFSSPHSSSTGFRSENTWHEIRDHSFIQNHSRSSDSQLLLFSSPHSSSTGFRSENTWHEIRDHSFIQNHSRSSDSQLLLFSSLTHLLQGSGQRTPDTRSETIPSYRITPDLQIHSFFSSVHSLIFYRVQVREHLTRDQRPFLHTESLQILQIHSFFSSVHLTHLLQGSDQKTPDTRSETIPSYRITPDLQIHSFSSSVHSLIFYRIQVREHLTWDQRPFLHPESLQIFRFTASPLQFTHSSSTGFRSENTWHEIRDHSFIQNHSRSFRFTASSLQFTSLIFYRVQIREHLTRDQRPFLHPESLQTLQIHSFFSSVHSLIFYRVQIREHLTRDQRPFLHPESLQIFRFTASSLQFTSLIFYRVQVREHLTRDQRPFLHPESLQIFRFTASPLQFTSLIFYRVQIREHLTRDQRPFLHPESLQILQIHSFFSSVHSLIFYRLQIREHLTRDQRPFLHPESLQIFRFTASSLQFTHSSSTGFRSENTWHEIRDHSFIQNHSRSFRFTASSLQFTSLIFYRVQIREHLTRDQRPFLHPESLQIFRFTASSLQFTHSSSTGFRSENTWHEIRDHSFIQNHSRSFRFTASSLQFTSLIFYRVQVREHLTRDQRPFLHPESLQIFRFTASPLQFTSLIFYRVQVRKHLTRDQRHSFIQNHSRSSDSQLLLFSSPHSSSTGFRSENTWHEIRDHSFIQNHSRPVRFTAPWRCFSLQYMAVARLWTFVRSRGGGCWRIVL